MIDSIGWTTRQGKAAWRDAGGVIDATGHHPYRVRVAGVMCRHKMPAPDVTPAAVASLFDGVEAMPAHLAYPVVGLALAALLPGHRPAPLTLTGPPDVGKTAVMVMSTHLCAPSSRVHDPVIPQGWPVLIGAQGPTVAAMPVCPGEVDTDRLDELDTHADQRAAAAAGLLVSVAGGSVSEAWIADTARRSLAALIAHHHTPRRVCAPLASAAVGWAALLDHARRVEALDAADAETWRQLVWAGLVEARDLMAPPVPVRPTAPVSAPPVPVRPTAPVSAPTVPVSAPTAEVSPEVAAVMAWASSSGRSVSEDEARAAWEVWHDVTGTRWPSTHGHIRAMLAGRTQWKTTQKPRTPDVALYRELLAQDDFWSQRSWVVTPGDPAASSHIQSVDINAQYLAAAGSVILGEGEGIHYTPEAGLPDEWWKKAGWLRLGEDVPDAPHSLMLNSRWWVPIPLAKYLVRDRGCDVTFTEALVWEEDRTALRMLATPWTKWRKALVEDSRPGASLALSMLKDAYARMFGGYLSAHNPDILPPEWQRPDWGALLRAQAEANMLRALDTVPDGCIVRSKYADTAFIEITQGASLDGWDRINATQPGKFKITGPRIPATTFRGLESPEQWRHAYAAAGGHE